MKCRVGDIAASVKNALVGGPFGSDLVSKDYVETGVPVIRGENLSLGRWVGGEFVFVSDAKAAALAANTAGPMDLVFTQRGANHYRQVALVPPDVTGRMLISQSQMKLTVNTSIADPMFIYYAFRAPEQQEYLRRNAIQTGVPHTNLGILRAVPLSLPPLSEQRCIVEILGALDDKIELNRRMNETLEALARTIFAEFTANSVSSVQIADVAEVNARQLTRHDRLEVVDYIEISEVHAGEIGAVARYDRGKEPSRAKRRLRHGDSVLSTVRPDRRSYFLAVEPAESLVVSTGFAVLSPRSVPWSFFHIAVTQPEVFSELGRFADGGAYPAVRPEVIASLEIPRVGDRLLHRFEETVTPLLLRREANRLESRTLAQLRDTLLPQLLSGELRVPAAEKELAAHV